MNLAFVYFDKANKDFKKHLSRYNYLLNNYFTNDDNSLIKKLNQTYKQLIKCCDSHEVLNKQETQIYNVIINFLANDLEDNQLKDIENSNFNNELKNKLIDKLTTELSEIDEDTLESALEKSINLMYDNPAQNVELLFIPSVVNLK